MNGWSSDQWRHSFLPVTNGLRNWTVYGCNNLLNKKGFRTLRITWILKTMELKLKQNSQVYALNKNNLFSLYFIQSSVSEVNEWMHRLEYYEWMKFCWHVELLSKGTNGTNKHIIGRSWRMRRFGCQPRL